MRYRDWASGPWAIIVGAALLWAGTMVVFSTVAWCH